MSLASRSSIVFAAFTLSACGLFGGNENSGSQQQAVTLTPGVHLIEHANPTCADLGLGTFEVKIEKNYNQTIALNAFGDTITVSSTDNEYFSWSSTIGMDAVLAKGGDNANAYVYDPEAFSGTNLVSPINDGNQVPTISHIDFCFDYEVRVTKTATPSYDRKYTWSIDKNAASTSLTLATGETYTMGYTVDVAATAANTSYAVSGDITVMNPAPLEATVTGVSDSFNGAPIAVSCPVTFPTTLASGASFKCTYTQALGGVVNGTNTATATTTGDVGPGTGTANVTFGAPTSTVDECIAIDDSRYGSLGTVCANASPYTKKIAYSYPIGPYADCGPASFENTASFTTNDTATKGSDSVTVGSTVTCAPTSCTLTQGYWKTHSSHGPAPYDDTWTSIEPSGESTTFFLSGMSWFGVYSIVPRDGAYWQLAHQYVAAKLNSLNGTSLASVQASFDAATAFLTAHTPAQVGKNGPLANQAKQLAAALDAFNSGRVGPGHCSE